MRVTDGTPRAHRARGTRGFAVWGAALAVVGGAAPFAGAAGVPEADLAYHGAATMSGGRVEVRLTPRNHGPSAVPDASVLLRWSKPLADGQQLPQACVRTAARDVVCRTGALAADGLGDQIVVVLRLRDRPDEVTLEIDTAWGGGAVDGNRANDKQRVLVLDTGDSYYF
ncbi:hypothetical protein ACWCQK_30940 [Streptomyces sp. NPDC002306]